MKREGIFCDKNIDDGEQTKRAPVALCPEIAIGKCVSCDEDICERHGSARGIVLTLQLVAVRCPAPDRLAEGTVAVCTTCLNKLALQPLLFKESIMLTLLEHISEAIKAALVGEALR